MKPIPYWFVMPVLLVDALLTQPLVADQPAVQPDIGASQWTAYEQKLKALQRDRPKDEYLGIYISGKRYRRDVQFWIRASPAYRKEGTWARRVTVFIDDTTGHRVRTAPDELLFQVAPPASFVGPAQRRTSNGEATVEILYGTGQQIASVDISTIPERTGLKAELPLATLARPMEAEPSEQRWRRQRVQPVSQDRVARLLSEASRAEKEGERDFASGFTWRYGMVFLRANEFQRANEALAQAESKFANARWAALCAWGQVVALRAAGRSVEGNAKAAEMVKKYPESIPAQFATERPGEIWVLPYF